MGAHLESIGVSQALFGQTRTAILSLLYGHPDESFYLRQLVRITGAGNGATQRELKQLSGAGLVTCKTVGRQTFYQANRSSPVFPEMRRLLLKSSGARDVLREALSPLNDKIEVAFVYGSIAAERDKTGSDLDLMIIGSVEFDEVIPQLGKAQEKLRREINPSVYPSEEWRLKVSSGNHFLKSVLSGRKVFVIGTERDLRDLSSKRLVKRPSEQRERNQKSSGRRRHQTR